MGVPASLIVLALAGLARLKAGNTLGAQFFEGNAPVHGFRMADARLAGTRVIQVLVEGNAPDTIKNPDVLRRMDELGSFIAHQPLPVGKVVSIVDLLKQMSLVMDRAGGGKLPDTTQGVAQYLLLYAMGGEEEDLAHFVDHDFQRAVITAYLKTDDFVAMKAMTVAAQAEADRLFKGLPGDGARRRRRHQRDRAQRDDGARQDHEPDPDLAAGPGDHVAAAALDRGRLPGAAAAGDRGAGEPGPDGLDRDPAVDGDRRHLGDGDRHRRRLRRLLHLPRARGVRAHGRSPPGDRRPR